MNIFVLDTNPTLAAQMHCDKHVVKMIVETAQILSTVWHQLTPAGATYGIPMLAYKPTHANHPCVKWAARNSSNYYWLWQLGMALCEEYTHRYGRTHKTEAVLQALEDWPHIMRSTVATSPQHFERCMPEDFAADYYALLTNHSSPQASVECYREFYRTAKAHLLTYTRRPIPSWIPTNLATYKTGA